MKKIEGFTRVNNERGALDCNDDGIDSEIGDELLEIQRPPRSDKCCDETNTEFNE